MEKLQKSSKTLHKGRKQGVRLMDFRRPFRRAFIQLGQGQLVRAEEPRVVLDLRDGGAVRHR